VKRSRAATIVAGLVLLVATTASSCDPGTVSNVEWREDARGNRICDITVRPDDLDSASFKLRGQRESVCKRCPEGARWPKCNKAKEGSNATRRD
jgi:hypothetical protein